GDLAREPDAVLRVDDSDEDHGREVDRDLAVLVLEVVPALGRLDGFAQVGELLLGQLGGEALSDPDSDLNLLSLFGHQWSSAGSTISVSTPSVARGCRNATRLPRMPVRGSVSMSSTSRAFSSLSTASMSSTR